MKTPTFFGLHAKPGLKLNWSLALLPFVIIVLAYMFISDARLAENPRDKITPSVSTMLETAYEYAFVADRKGHYRLLEDSSYSLMRLISGVALAAIVGLFLGVNTALFPGMNSTLNPFITFLSIIPPLALLPVFLITLGTGEIAKILLIFAGVVFLITRDIYKETRAIPKEQITKALTLGANQWEVVYKIVFPQIMPVLLNTTRLSLGAAWLFLIAGEAIASTNGLGYTIYVVKRYLAMDAIIPYVLVITALGFIMDWGLSKFIKWKYSWFVAIREGK